eukprot:9913517-Heterocapsa_arctica.AAC.1
MKSEKHLEGAKEKQDKVMKELANAKDEVAAAYAAHASAAAKLDKLEKLIKAQMEIKDESVVTEEEVEAVKRMRSIRAGNAGAVGGLPYKQTVAEIMEGHGRKPMIADTPKGLLPKADPAGRPAPSTPQGQAGG